MKPGLLNILACPICKHYPLKLIIINWQTKESDFSKINDALNKNGLQYLKDQTKRSIKVPKKEEIQAVNFGISKKSGRPILHDDLIRPRLTAKTYITRLIEYLDVLNYIENKDEKINNYLNILKDDIYKQILEIKDKLTDSDSDNIEILKKQQIILFYLNWFFERTEIDEGLMFCSKCNRWYPIIETIPRMLPDDLRKKREDLIFLNKVKDDIPDDILKIGKPFMI